MTDDIKLLPLPYPQIPGNDYTASDMHAYAVAAVEADRAQMGEPVAWYSKQYGVVWMAIKPGNLVAGTQWFIRGRQEPVAEVVSSVSLVWHIATSELAHGTVFYSAPQPAEPVKVPSDVWALVEKYADAVSNYNEAVRIDVGINKAGQECLAIEKDLRALLSRYSKPALLSSNPGTLSSKPKPAASAEPDCWCETCRPITMQDMRMVLCPICGNKRCPHATDHRNACTGSNEPGQPGSSYGPRAASVAQEPVDLEHSRALREGERNAAEDAFFKARPKLDDTPYRVLFRAGFDRGYDAAPVTAQAQPTVTDEMVTRFLGWKLPEDFAPDAGISFKPPNNPLFWPVGTNLFTASQARAMLEYVLLGVQK